MKKIKTTVAGMLATTTLFLGQAQAVLAANDKGDGAGGGDAGQIKEKLTKAGKTVQGILTGLVVLVGICVALWIIIKRMPSADDPREKSEVYHALGRVGGLVALAAAVIWLLPAVYSLFT